VSETLLNRLLTASAERNPARVAVSDRGRTLTYSELEAQANRLASLLAEKGVRKGDRVGLYLDKSLESLIGIYGTLKAGGVYVPFDPQAPTSRLAYIAANAGIRVLLTGKEKEDRWDELLAGTPGIEFLVVLNAAESAVADPQAPVVLLAEAALASAPQTLPNITQSPSDLAYILYTSGSTGEPKGVMLSHENALAFVDPAVKEFSITSEDRLSSHAPLHFDLSVFDLYAAAEAGAAVILVPPTTAMFPAELARFISEESISVWYSVPSALTLLVTRGALQPGAFPQLRTILFAGEVFPMKYLLRLMDLLPHVLFHNLYGPTETNVCTWYEVPRFPDGGAPATIPIGRAIPNVDAYSVDDRGEPVGLGEVGELYVAGPTVMHGYWGDPERTSNALFEQGGSRVYRTGDLVQEGADGNFLFLGRRDAQIKSRGYRIELGEIETALYEHPLVAECAVVAMPDELVTNRIKAVVSTRSPVEEADLIEHCRSRLPRYMIPELFEFRAELPKSSTGKIARKLLQDGAVRNAAKTS
jgi:amino acid adenylation domain-containing protein